MFNPGQAFSYCLGPENDGHLHGLFESDPVGLEFLPAHFRKRDVEVPVKVDGPAALPLSGTLSA